MNTGESVVDHQPIPLILLNCAYKAFSDKVLKLLVSEELVLKKIPVSVFTTRLIIKSQDKRGTREESPAQCACLKIRAFLILIPKTHETAEHVSLRRGPRQRVHNEAVFDFPFQAEIRKIGALHSATS